MCDLGADPGGGQRKPRGWGPLLVGCHHGNPQEAPKGLGWNPQEERVAYVLDSRPFTAHGLQLDRQSSSSRREWRQGWLVFSVVVPCWQAFVRFRSAYPCWVVA